MPARLVPAGGRSINFKSPRLRFRLLNVQRPRLWKQVKDVKGTLPQIQLKPQLDSEKWNVSLKGESKRVSFLAGRNMKSVMVVPAFVSSVGICGSLDCFFHEMKTSGSHWEFPPYFRGHSHQRGTYWWNWGFKLWHNFSCCSGVKNYALSWLIWIMAKKRTKILTQTCICVIACEAAASFFFFLVIVLSCPSC